MATHFRTVGSECPPQHAWLNVRVHIILKLFGLCVAQTAQSVEAPLKVSCLSPRSDDLLVIPPFQTPGYVAREGRLSRSRWPSNKHWSPRRQRHVDGQFNLVVVNINKTVSPIATECPIIAPLSAGFPDKLR